MADRKYHEPAQLDIAKLSAGRRLDVEPIRTNCPECNAAYSVRAENLGKRAKCAKCGVAFVLARARDSKVPERADVDEDLGACRFCGFQDSGNFCSNCGGRLRGESFPNLETCRVPESYYSQLCSEVLIDFDAPSHIREQQQREYELRSACERFNDQISEMSRTIKYGGFESAGWQFERVQIARLIDSLPPEVPGRTEIASRLWFVASEVERRVFENKLTQISTEFDGAIEGSDAKKAARLVSKMKELIGDNPRSDLRSRLASCESELAGIETTMRDGKLLAEFQKLKTKAEKLAFQGENKKAIKAFQECLFWLSRNEIDGKALQQATIEQAIQKLEIE